MSAPVIVPTIHAPIVSDWTKAIGDFLKRLAEGIVDAGAALVLTIDEGYRQLDALRFICMRYGWCFTPDFPLNSLLNSAFELKTTRTPQHVLYRHVRDFLTSNNWQVLRSMLNDESVALTLGSKRRKILGDCLYALPLHGRDRFNAAHLIVPTLLSILDGIISDFALKHLIIHNWHEKKNKLIVKSELGTVCFSFDEPALDLLFEVLFANARAGSKPASGRRFNRHHIVHGNWLEFGRLEYVLRLFLLICFATYIVCEYEQRKASGSTGPVTPRSQYSSILSENFVATLREPALQRLQSRRPTALAPKHTLTTTVTMESSSNTPYVFVHPDC